MDLKFNSWSIYQTDFIANSGQRGITDHGSNGSLLLVPGSRYLLVLWWPLASHVGSNVQGSPVICSDSDKKFIQLSRWLTTAANTANTAPEIRLWMPTQGWNFLLVSVCLLSVLCYVLCGYVLCGYVDTYVGLLHVSVSSLSPASPVPLFVWRVHCLHCLLSPPPLSRSLSLSQIVETDFRNCLQFLQAH